jgi:2,3-bisphosphoglycerate-independent phosphoglycerate mutase
MDGAAVSAVDTVKGLAKSACMEAPDIPGATGFTDTDYEAKANAALDLLRRVDLVYVHVEAIDEMGHSGDVRGKISAIQDFDSRLATNLIRGLESRGYDYRVAVIPDHYTPCSVRTHVRDPTPFVIAPSERGSDGPEYDEESAKSGELGILSGDSFLRTLIGS